MLKEWRLVFVVELHHLVILSLARPTFSPYSTKKKGRGPRQNHPQRRKRVNRRTRTRRGQRRQAIGQLTRGPALLYSAIGNPRGQTCPEGLGRQTGACGQSALRRSLGCLGRSSTAGNTACKWTSVPRAGPLGTAPDRWRCTASTCRNSGRESSCWARSPR